MTGQPVFPEYYQHQQTPLPREKTVREDLEDVVRQLEEQERRKKQQAAAAAAAKAAEAAMCAANSYAHGFSYGASDELAGLAGIGGGMVANVQSGQDPMHDWQNSYTEVRDDFRNYRKNCEAKYPELTTAAEMAGMMSNPIKFRKTAPFAPRSVYLRNDVINSAIGAGVYGFNSSDGDIYDRMENAAQFAAVGWGIPKTRQNKYLAEYIPPFKGGTWGTITRGIFDNGLQNLITKFIDEK